MYMCMLISGGIPHRLMEGIIGSGHATSHHEFASTTPLLFGV